MEETQKSKVLDFQYKTKFVKECRVLEYNSPHRDEKEAELDIEMAEKFFGFMERLPFGESSVNFKVRYIPNPDGTYSPMFYQLEIEKLDNRPVFFEGEKLTL